MAQTTIQGSFLGDATVTGAKIGADFISAQTALTTGLATTDEIIVSDAGVIKRMDISVIEIAASQITASGTLPALNGAALTALTAANITASGTLPALNGAALTALTAANITASGTLPALNGAALTALNASNLGSGTVPTARLGSGTANNSVFLRGDGTWNAAGGGDWHDLLSDGLHNGTFANIFFLGPNQYDAISTSNNNDQFGLGNAFKAEIYGGGSSSTLSQHSDFRGLGWAITSGNADQRRFVLYAGGQCVAVNDDWTIQCTINSASGNMFEFGLITNPANYKPHSNASYRSICFFQDSGTDIGLCTSDGTTRSLRLVSGWNYSNTHKIKLMIREAGTKVSLVVDGTTVVDETTNNLPTGWTGMFLYLNASSWSANSRTTHLRDFIAFSEG